MVLYRKIIYHNEIFYIERSNDYQLKINIYYRYKDKLYWCLTLNKMKNDIIDINIIKSYLKNINIKELRKIKG